MAEWRGVAHSAEATAAIGAALARAAPAATAAPAILYLRGDLGAGKTTLARGFLAQLGVADRVRSPTYTLVECHPFAHGVVVHLDLYRLRGPRELEMLGVRDLARPAHLWLIEWPERALAGLPAADLGAHLEVGSAGHSIALAALSSIGSEWLQRAVEILAQPS